MMWKLITYVYLIAVSGFAGAAIGSGVGSAISEMTGQSDFVLHGRCVGWIAFTLLAAVGAPLGFIRFCGDGGRRRKTPDLPSGRLPFEHERAARGGQRTEGGIKAVLMAPLIGGLMGLILAFPLSGIVTALYFFVTLSPVAPNGWWPILPPAFRSIGDSFAHVILAIAANCVILGAVVAFLAGVSCGNTRFQVFGRRDWGAANQPRDHEPSKKKHASCGSRVS